MSIIETLNNYISTDVVQDSEFKKATRDWSACMAKNGFSSPDPGSLGQQAQITLGQGQGPAPGQNPTDLAGIYFAVQANYEQQFVSANQQALNAGVREYKAAFAKALKTLPALLRTTSATPNLPGPPPGHRGRHSRSAKPSPSHS
jgi:hypothetical protein